MRTKYPKHLLPFPYLGLRQYSLTFCTFDRSDRFVAGEVVSRVSTQVLRAASETDFVIIAACYMPDHVHFGVEGTSEVSDLKAFIKRAKQYSGFYHKHATGETLWQRYGYEHIVRDNESLKTIVRYAIENPVRKQLVKDVKEYPYTQSGKYSLAELIDFAYDGRERWG